MKTTAYWYFNRRTKGSAPGNTGAIAGADRQSAIKITRARETIGNDNKMLSQGSLPRKAINHTMTVLRLTLKLWRFFCCYGLRRFLTATVVLLKIGLRVENPHEYQEEKPHIKSTDMLLDPSTWQQPKSMDLG